MKVIAVVDLLVISHAAKALRQFTPILDSSDFDIWLSYGEFIPRLCEGYLFWGAGKFALGLQAVDSSRRFSSPGADWLPRLSHEFLGRVVHGGSLTEAVTEFPERAWFKFAELKHDMVLPGVRSHDELSELLSSHPELSDVRVQWTESVLHLNFEHRFFVVDGLLLTGSPYLVDGVVGFENTSAWREFDAASKFAAHAAWELRDVSPRSYTLDVALDESSDKWVVVEANRSWSSGFYGSDVELGLIAVRESLSGDGWDWKPDAVVHSYKSILSVVDNPENAIGLIKIGS